jgi:hypothetical protein
MTVSRWTSPLLATGLTAVLMLIGVPAASAAVGSTTDASGDNAGPGLDIVAASVDSGDDVLTATMTFRRVRSGEAIFAVKAKDLGLMRFVSMRHVDGSSRDFMLNRSGRVTCDGFTATWDESAIAVTFVVPSSCLWSGDYETVRAPWILTEGANGGSDVDLAGPINNVTRG